MNAACEDREKYHYFTHPAKDQTNSNPTSTKEKEWGHEKRGNPHQEREKVKKGKQEES